MPPTGRGGRRPARPGRPVGRNHPGPRSTSGGRGGNRTQPASSASAHARGPAQPATGRRAAAKGLGGEQVEGRQAVRELLLAGRRKVHEVWVSSELEDAGVISDIVDLAAARRVPVQEVARRRLEATGSQRSAAGRARQAAALPEVELDDLVDGKGRTAPFLVAVDGVTDPGNLGALLRSAEGAGVTGVVLPRHRAVHITPTAAKAAAGAIEHLDLAVVPGLPAALQRLATQRLWIVGLDDAAERSLFDLGDLASEPIVFVLGAEGAG